jgi:S1-C subfamily serine protease
VVYRQTLKSVTLVYHGEGAGSGFLVDESDRLLVTAYHVVKDEDDVSVVFPAFKTDQTVIADREHYFSVRDRRTHIPGKVVLRRKNQDLALIQLDRIPVGFKAIQLAAERAKPGEAVFTVGNPGASGGMWIFSDGAVRQIFDQQEFSLKGAQSGVADIVETQNPTNPGDSGGPVVNSRGELIGMTMSGIVDEEVDLVSQCIDVTEIKRLLSQFRRQ